MFDPCGLCHIHYRLGSKDIWRESASAHHLRRSAKQRFQLTDRRCGRLAFLDMCMHDKKSHGHRIIQIVLPLHCVQKCQEINKLLLVLII